MEDRIHTLLKVKQEKRELVVHGLAERYFEKVKWQAIQVSGDWRVDIEFERSVPPRQRTVITTLVVDGGTPFTTQEANLLDKVNFDRLPLLPFQMNY